MIRKHNSDVETSSQRLISMSFFKKINYEKKSFPLKGFGKEICNIAKKRKSVITLTSEKLDKVGLEELSRRNSDKFLRFGPSEEAMLGIATGMSYTGRFPFIVGLSRHFPMRSIDFLRAASYSDESMVLVGVDEGKSFRRDYLDEDLSVVNSIEGVTMVVPCDEKQCREASLSLVQKGGISFMRVPEEVPFSITDNLSFELGKAEVLDAGEDVVLVSCGRGVHLCLEAREVLKNKGYSVAVINFHTIRPLDDITLLSYAKSSRGVVVVDDYGVNGVLGCEVSKILSKYGDLYYDFVYSKANSFVETGMEGEEKSYNLTDDERKFFVDEIIRKTRYVYKRKTGNFNYKR